MNVRGWIFGLLLLTSAGCQTASFVAFDNNEVREITVLYTNDEHGWMEGMEPGHGAASLYRLWQEQEGLVEGGPFLILSGGDNWTGPAISTWVEGESMVEIMNGMHYDASAIGNHEFDFGLEVLEQRIAEADFPYLSTNTRWKANGEVPVELGILPYTLKEVNGIKVGIIGLTTTSTPRTANPLLVSELQFHNYEQALRSAVAEVQTTAPDLLFVIAHVCMAELQPLALAVADLGIDLMGGGHCNELVARKVGDTILLGGGYHFTSYARARIRFDPSKDRILGIEFAVNFNESAGADSGIAAIVDRWKEQFEVLLDEVIAWSDFEIDHRSRELRQAVIDSWLISDPGADIAITNAGGLRTPLPAGEIILDDLVNLMPFENNIYAVELTGRAVVEAIEVGGRPIVAGLIRQGDGWLVKDSGQPIDPDGLYRVLINSFMYAGGDNFQIIRETDPDGYDTGVHYRQPFVDLLLSLRTGPDNPLRMTDLVRATSQ